MRQFARPPVLEESEEPAEPGDAEEGAVVYAEPAAGTDAVGATAAMETTPDATETAALPMAVEL